MINLRYHIVSLTAVFLAIGIGLTMGSTFLDRATVENLNGQLENLETRLGDREEQVNELQSALDEAGSAQAALDEDGPSLLAGTVEDVPVVVLASQGVAEDAVDGTVESLVVAGADVQGVWWLTDRFLLDDGSHIADLAEVLGSTSQDPARLRRLAIERLGSAVRERQSLSLVTDDGPTDEDATTDDPIADDDGAGETDDAGAPIEPAGTTTSVPDDADSSDPDADELDPAASTIDAPFAEALSEAGFLEFSPVSGGSDVPVYPAGSRLVVIGGSAALPDDVVVEPLVDRLTRGTSRPTLTVVSSGMAGAPDVSEAVSVIRSDDRLRSLVSTVDGLENFQGWAALVLAVADLGDGVVGHYGLGDGATALLPPSPTP